MLVKKSKILSLILIVAMLLGILPVNSFATSSNGAISRAEFIAKIVDYFGWPHPSEYNDIWEDYAVAKGLIDYTFNDVSLSDPYGKQIEIAYAEGLISPDAKGNFNPNQPISREDAAVIIAKAWMLPPSDTPTPYQDDKNISDAAKGSVYKLVELGCMEGRTQKTFVPRANIKGTEVDSIIDALTRTVAAPVYALPRQNYEAPRRYVKLYCADRDTTIIYTNDGSDPLTSPTAKVWDVTVNGYINENSQSGRERRDVVYKAYSIKDGLIASEVQTFTWHLYRPVTAPFESVKILEGTATRPTVYEIWNDADGVRAMMWYIEGPERGIIFDMGGVTTPDLKEYIDQNLATKPYIAIVGHAHPDHVAQASFFANAGIDTYSNVRSGWSRFRTTVTDENKKYIHNIDWGDKFDLGGGIVFDVYALPGHSDDLVILNDKQNGLVFATDIYGCTRAGSADNVNVAGVKVDMLLSMAQQVHAAYLENSGFVDMLFTGHDETPLNENNLFLFEAALQQVIDKGEAGCSPTLRGNNDAPGSRTTLIGDMWKDNTNWISLKLAGKMGDDTEYLTHNAQFNYNSEGGYLKYSVLSNVVIKGGDLVGVDLTWGNPITLDWLGTSTTVPKALPDMFDPWTYDYTIKVAPGISQITVIPTTMSTQVKSLKLNGVEVGYNSSNTISVSDGTVFTITVVAPDNVTTSTYTFTVVEG